MKLLKIFSTAILILFAYIIYILIFNYSFIVDNYETFFSNEAIRHIIFSPTICLFKNSTGLPCPGCGMSRAYYALFKLNIKNAFFYHPLFILPSLLLVIFIFRKNTFVEKRIIGNNILWIVIAIVIMVVWAIRFIFLFPHTEPFVYYKQNLFLNIANFIIRLVN